MANSIDLVFGTQAIESIEKVLKRLEATDLALIKAAQSSLILNKNLSISVPSDLDKNTQSNANLNAQLEKQNKIITDLHANLAKRAEQSRLAEIKLQQAREKAFDSYERNSKREQATAEKNASLYNKTQTQINSLTKAYNDLAVRKERYNNLTANEEMRLNTLQKVTEKYNGVLKQTDAQIGKNNRNVGNYASGWNGLGNSINQLTREAPAFAVSMNTGFLALSNNIPMLFDEINKLKNENIALAKSGEPTKSILKQLATAFFSWGTALSLGVTLLTLYGGKMIEFISASLKGKEATKSLAENQKLLNDTLKESSGQYAEEKVNIEVLYKTATDLNASYVDRKRAVDELQDLYPFYFKNLSDEDIMVGKAKDQYNLLSQAIVTTAKARASEEILRKRESERLVIEQQELDTTMKKYAELAKAKGTSTMVLGGGSVGGGATSVVTETASQQKERLRKEIQDLRTESIKQREAWAKEDAFFIDKIAQGNAIEDTLKPAEKVKIAKAKKEREQKREDLEPIKNEIIVRGTLIEELDKQIDRLLTLKILNAGDVEITKDINAQLEILKNTRKELFGTPTVDFEIIPKAKEQLKEVKELSDESKAFFDSFISDFANNSGFGETLNLFSDEFDFMERTAEEKTVAIMESFQEMFNFISNASQANFDAERARLQDQYDISVVFAGDSASAKAKLAEDLEKKQKEIANRENKAKQKQAIFNIAIDTAQGVISALASTPPNVPLSILIGVLGAAQIAMVASQKIPQYFDGTDNHSGGLMLVNDGGGSNYREKVITPDGKEFTPQGRNVLLDAPKGTKVLTHEQQIHEMLNERGISMNRTIQNNGMTAQEMDEVMSKHFSKIQTNVTNIDKNGISSYISKNGNKTINHNARVSRTGFNV